MSKKKIKMITITKAEFDMLHYEAGLFYEIDGLSQISEEEEKKLRRLDKLSVDYSADIWRTESEKEVE